MPAPLAKELGHPARITFRRSGDLTVVAPGGPGGAAAAAGAARPADERWPEDDPPSETSLEVNILRYLANCLERRHGLAEGTVVPVSPTQRRERWLGFDAVVGLPQGSYAALQFKRPRPAGNGAARFGIGGLQAMTLLRYPPGSAFYVLPPVRTDERMAGLGRCLLHGARLVDARYMLAPIAESWRAARAVSGGGRARDDWGACTAHVDGGGEVRVRAAGGRHRLPWHFVPSAAASTLCGGADNVGFDVRNRRIVARGGGGGWGLAGWLAAAGRALGAPGLRRADGEDEAAADAAGAAGAAGDRPGRRPELEEEAKPRFLRAFDPEAGAEAGAEDEGGGAYWIPIAGVP